MKKLNKIMRIICLIGWAIVCGMSLVFVIRGEPVRPITALIPAIVCVMHYIEVVYRDNHPGGKE